MHQITAYGGQKPVPFQQAIPQSPGWFPVPSNYVQENTTQNFLALLNVSTIEKARQLPSETVIAVNALQIASAPYGSYLYGPVVDGIFVPALPPLLLSAGAFAKDLKVMVGHNADEGPLFTDPRMANGSLEAVFLETNFPGINPAVVSYITTTLYPPVYDGSQPYTSAIERAVLIVSELIFTCNSKSILSRACRDIVPDLESQGQCLRDVDSGFVRMPRTQCPWFI
jgi:carboxylesterase type B